MEFWESSAMPDDVKRVIKEIYWEHRNKLLFCQKLKGCVRRILEHGNQDDALDAVKEMKTSIIRYSEYLKKPCVVLCFSNNKSIAYRLNTMVFFYHEYIEDLGGDYSVYQDLFCDEELPYSSTEEEDEEVIYRNVIMASTEEKISWSECQKIVISDYDVTLL
nr:cell cycle link protein [Banana bunchy top virus]WET17327.1 cell cycle link protein [Banana bunchy top virus]WET17333.1 cell cycle link protein [Banana bunchy top virus]